MHRTAHLVPIALAVILSCLLDSPSSAQRIDDLENVEHYPEAWIKIDARPIIDNNRLFKKYKECFLMEKPMGCPRDITSMRKVMPAAMEDLCSKCLPGHIARGKEIMEYACVKRRNDVVEISQKVDPDGSFRRRWEAKYGPIDCDLTCKPGMTDPCLDYSGTTDGSDWQHS